jgi:hypothetical protein
MYANTTQAPGLTVNDALIITIEEDLLEQAIFYVLPFCTEYVVQVMEKFDLVKWYRYTDEEKEMFISEYDKNGFLKFCRFVEDHIGIIKGTVFFLKVSTNFGFTAAKYMAARSGNLAKVNSLTSCINVSGLSILAGNLTVYFFHDLVCMALRRYYFKKVKARSSIANGLVPARLSYVSIDMEASLNSEQVVIDMQGFDQPSSGYSSNLNSPSTLNTDSNSMADSSFSGIKLRNLHSSSIDEMSHPKVLEGPPEAHGIRLTSRRTVNNMTLYGYKEVS